MQNKAQANTEKWKNGSLEENSAPKPKRILMGSKVKKNELYKS